MHLKRLELKGFKSFATYTELEFVPGVTAVVGPNGSGKSNVADAVRWVLGEQSARTLRGGKMEDVIFGGSDSRRAINYCDVSLTLDNREGELPLAYNEVTVTRRLYRSGDSEYYINRQPCRLKDITELFMDTGLGKEAYSIIGQGRIDDILSTKPEDRRGIFEEAAGIVKFKARKREAERKLEETEQNLARLHDVIYELKEQAEPLAEQAQTAREYRRLREQLEQSEIGLYVHNIALLHNEWEQSNEQLAKLTEEKLAVEAILNQQEAEMEKRKWQFQQLDQQFETEQQKLLETSEALEKAEGQYDVLSERERNRHQEEERFQEQAANLHKRLQHIVQDLKQVEQQLQQKEQEVKRTREELQQREENLQQLAEGAAERLENVKSDMIELMGEQASLNNDLRYLDEQEQHNRDQLVSLEAEIEQAQKLLTQVDQQVEDYEKESVTIADELQSCIEQHESIVHKLEVVRKSEEQLTDSLRSLEQKEHRLISRHEVLHELEADFSGFNQGVKEVLKAREKEKLAGIEGAVAEVVNVPQKLEMAIETALGGALQHVVVQSEQHGRAAIAYLKQHRLGRATFLPMDVIRPRRLLTKDNGRIRSDKGLVGIAVDLVRFDDTYSNIISSLLGNVVIAHTIEDANRIARLLQYRYRVVTLDGDIVNPGGSMSGGSAQKRNTNLLGRKRELEEIDQQIDSVKTDKKRLAAAIEKHMQQKEALANELEQVRTAAESLRLEEQKLSGQLAQKNAERKHTAEQLERLHNERNRLINETDGIHKKRDQIRAELAKKREAEEQLNREHTRLEQLLKDEEQQKKTASEHITELKVILAKQVQEQEHLEENRHRLVQEQHSLESEQHVLKRQMDDLVKRIASNEQEKQDYEQTIEKLRLQKAEVLDQLEHIRNQRTEQQSELNEYDAVNREYRKNVQAVEAKLHKQEVKVNRLDVSLNNMLTALNEQYEISYELAKERYEIPTDPEQAEATVRRLKQQISDLGEVNLGAIEESERVNERLAFLEGQQQDLLDAKATLYDVIHNINEEMSKRFEKTFKQIREQFQTVFVELFGGGRADLSLSNPDSLLQTGIDIVAQPPGKKLQHLSLLSGGERTLTAIGLLFAIIRVRPVPFCILDEVEAALDEANVVRFARYLKQYSKHTQFIVITHRKGTMEEADVLYGVTMQESGVSNLVSVRLDGGDGALKEVAAASE